MVLVMGYMQSLLWAFVGDKNQMVSCPNNIDMLQGWAWRGYESTGLWGLCVRGFR